MESTKLTEQQQKLLQWAEGKELSAILKRVQQYTIHAEGSNNNAPDSPEWHALDAEQRTMRENAKLLMDAYAISEAMRMATMPVFERVKPMSELFQGGNGDLSYFVDRIADALAAFTRCSIRRYAEYDREEHVWMHRVYGYESDLRYFVFLYTTLRLHFVGALKPEINPALSLGENVFILHSAGYGWHEIAKMYGWSVRRFDADGDEVFHRDARATEVWYSPEGERWTGETRILMRKWRTPYFAFCKKNGEEPVMNVRSSSFRLDAAQGYLDGIHKKIRETEAKVKLEGGSALALRMDDLEQFIREEAGNCVRCPACKLLSICRWQCDCCGNTEGMPEQPPAPAQECPKCKKSKNGCNEHRIRLGRTHYRKFSEAGYAAGQRQAATADLGGAKASTAQTKSIH